MTAAALIAVWLASVFACAKQADASGLLIADGGMGVCLGALFGCCAPLFSGIGQSKSRWPKGFGGACWH